MMPREIDIREIKTAVKELCIEANTRLRPDVFNAINELYGKEPADSARKRMLKILVDNAETAMEENLAICQDTGLVTVFIDIGDGILLKGGNIVKAVNLGVKEAYEEASFRRSVVDDPILRNNTGTNTPAIVHLDIVAGTDINISVLPKGFGSENKSCVAMLNPTSGVEEIIDFCVEAVKKAGSDACPPYVLGIGIGGTFEACTMMAKKALLRPIDQDSLKQHIAEMEKIIKKKVDGLGIGIMGLGGISTAMGVNIEVGPTHIAGMPVAVNISCHALRSATRTI